MLKIVEILCERLNEKGVSYCHWKSTAFLDAALSGEDDLDLLIVAPDRSRFESVLFELEFVPAYHDGETYSPLCHYIGLDRASSKLVHVHAHFHLQTGGSLVEGFQLAPLEKYLVEDAVLALGKIPIPRPHKDLTGLALRKSLAFGSLIENTLILREGTRALVKEYRHLLNNDSELEKRAQNDIMSLFPFLDERQVLDCFDKIKNESTFWHRWISGFRLRQKFHQYRVKPPLIESMTRVFRLVQALARRALTGPAKFSIKNGGMVIAVVGGDASGKSTLCTSLAEHLEQKFLIERAHAGLPPPTLLTILPRLILPLVRQLLPTARTTQVGNELYDNFNSPTLAASRMATWKQYLFAVRSVMVAYERRQLLIRLWKKTARKGHLIVVDRYPCRVHGPPDSPQIDAMKMNFKSGSVLHKLQLLEKKLYSQLPPAGLLLKLELSADTAVSRNAKRIKKGNESTEYVLRRHAAVKLQDFSYCPNYVEIDASQNAEKVFEDALYTVWRHL